MRSLKTWKSLWLQPGPLPLFCLPTSPAANGSSDGRPHISKISQHLLLSSSKLKRQLLLYLFHQLVLLPMNISPLCLVAGFELLEAQIKQQQFFACQAPPGSGRLYGQPENEYLRRPDECLPVRSGAPSPLLTIQDNGQVFAPRPFPSTAARPFGSVLVRA